MNIDTAIAFAALAHAGQTRKYDGLPYITHPIEVMSLVHAHGGTEDMKMAAILHDVVEDTPVGIITIERRFGPDVAALVLELTDVYTSEAYPDRNRRERKRLERMRVGETSAAAQTIKFADLVSNTRSIIQYDIGFARVYLEEKERMLELMNDGDKRLRALAWASLADAQQELVQCQLKSKSPQPGAQP